MEVEYPQDGAVISDFICGAFISGRAHAGRSGFDVAIVLDTSRSTIDPSGADVDGDGVVGTTAPDRGAAIFHAANSDPDDSILAAEVAAARELLGQLDPGITRVSLVAFSGDPRGLPGATPEPAATVLEPLTSDFPRIEAALEELRRQVPRGATHMAAGLDRARIALAEPSGGSSDAEREKVVFFFTDGQPTLPHGPGLEAANILEVLDAVGRAERAGLRIHSFAIGAEALEGPLAVVEMARQTGGYFVPVRRPGDLIHADRHGAVVIRPEHTHQLPEAVDEVKRRETPILEAARAEGFDLATLLQLWSDKDDVH